MERTLAKMDDRRQSAVDKETESDSDDDDVPIAQTLVSAVEEVKEVEIDNDIAQTNERGGRKRTPRQNMIGIKVAREFGKKDIVI
jgi:hypothetical protein